MFDKKSIDALHTELRDKYELEPEWENLLKSATLGVALSDAGAPLKSIDKRVVALIDKHKPA